MGGVLKTFKTFVAWMPTESARHLKCLKMFVRGLVLPLESTSTLAAVDFFLPVSTPGRRAAGEPCMEGGLGAVFLAFMAVGPQVHPASKSAWRFDCWRLLLPDEAFPRSEPCYFFSGRDGDVG